VPGQVQGRGPDEGDHGALAGAVADQVLLDLDRVGRRRHHDRAAAPAHRAACLLGAQEHAVDVHVEDALPLLVGHVQERPNVGDPGVRDHDVQVPRVLDAGADRTLHVGAAAHVAADGERILAQPGGGLPGQVGVQVHQHDPGLARDEVLGDRGADSLGGAGHDDAASREAAGHRTSWRTGPASRRALSANASMSSALVSAPISSV
jgi:hypothetical protein